MGLATPLRHTTMSFFYRSQSAVFDGLTRFSTLPLGRSGAPRPQTFSANLPADAGIWSPHEAVQSALAGSAGNTIEGIRDPELRYQGSNVLAYLLHNVQFFQDNPGTGPAITMRATNSPGVDEAGLALSFSLNRDALVLGSNGDLFWTGCRILTPNTELVFTGDGLAGGIDIALELIPITDPGTFTSICLALAFDNLN